MDKNIPNTLHIRTLQTSLHVTFWLVSCLVYTQTQTQNIPGLRYILVDDDVHLEAIFFVFKFKKKIKINLNYGVFDYFIANNF